MHCCFRFPCCCCWGKRTKKNKRDKNGENSKSRSETAFTNVNGNIQARSFAFRELASATNNFMPDSLLGEGGFGRVYKGCIENSDQVVAIKQLDRNGLEGNREFLVKILMLSFLHHPNLVKLVGYCADGDQRLLVYEYMANGSLQDHLFDLQPNKTPLDWSTRIGIAFGAAQGLEYLHDKANPPVTYGNLKSSTILLDDELTPKLSDFGLIKLGPVGDMPAASSRVMGTYGYCAPEYARSGNISLKADVYSFGVVLLELITGRKAIDPTKPTNDQNLVTWVQPMFKDQKRYKELVDPVLENNYPLKALNQAVAIAAMCIQEEPAVRPFMSDVVVTLRFLAEAPQLPQQMPSSPDQIEMSHYSNPSLSLSFSGSSGDHIIESDQLGIVTLGNCESETSSGSL